MLKNMFLQMIPSIVDPVISGILSLLFILSLILLLILTILTLRLIDMLTFLHEIKNDKIFTK